MSESARKGLAEGVATLVFVFSIVAILNAGVAAALPIGFALMVLVYAVGHISGGHLNPAVSVGVFLRGRLSATDLVIYIVAQLVGGALGALLSVALWERPAEGLQIETGPAFLAELIFTFLLVFVVLNVATSKDHPDNSFYGLAIGSVVFVGASAVGAISGGAFNPAVGFGLAVSGAFTWGSLWLYFVAPVVGGALAALLFRVLNPHDLEKAAA